MSYINSRRYKETENGEICLDEDLDNHNSYALMPGPGSYDPFPNSYARPKTMATFSRCRSRRSLFDVDSNPGPGEYTSTSPPPKSLEGNKYHSREAVDDERSATFKSDTKLHYQKVETFFNDFKKFFRYPMSTKSLRGLEHMARCFGIENPLFTVPLDLDLR